jgi:2-polyprenyl-3-methyl-5-hydroxy-6-metoxy-1,4-benzoquinol methylase
MSLPPHERYKEKLFPGSSHSWALAQCEPIERSVAVLDVGSGSGVMGAKLRELGFGCISAVEQDVQARAQTASLYTDVAPLLSCFAGRTFGLVLLLDVVEHMAHPEEFLAELRPLLSPGATLLLSVPNVAHWSVRLPLLFGSFRYTERGILDETHLRFFTRSSLRRFLKRIGWLSIGGESVSVPPVEFVLPQPVWNNRVFRALSSAHYHTAQVIPGFFGYQLLTALRYSPE